MLATKTVSLRASINVAPDAAPLSQDEHVDLVVVGSGIAGLSVAYEFALAGKRVAVVDRGKIGSGMTARTTAHLTSICDDLFSELIKLRGREMARAYYESHSAAVDRIEAIQMPFLLLRPQSGSGVPAEAQYALHTTKIA